MLDKKGNFYIMDAILAIILLLVVFLAINTVISLPSPNYSSESKNFNDAQDIMEVLSGKIDFGDRTFIGDVSAILEDGKNSKESIRQASDFSKDKFKSMGIKNYRFSETNVLGDEVLSASGDYSKAKDVSTATRTYGDYFYTLSVW